jgi:hypothetical protein
MAITGAYNFKGIDLPNAYLRFVSISGTNKSGWVGQVGVYASAAAAADVTDEGTVVGTTQTIPVTRTPAPLDTLSVSAGYDATKSLYEVLYAALKAQPYAAGMTDVLESGQEV